MTHIRRRRRQVFFLRYRIGNEKPKRTSKERREASEAHQARLRLPYRAPRKIHPKLQPRNGWGLFHEFGRGWGWSRGPCGDKVRMSYGDLPCAFYDWPDLAPELQDAYLAKRRAAKQAERDRVAYFVPLPPITFQDFVFPVIKQAKFGSNPIADLVGVHPMSKPRTNERSRYSNAPTGSV